MCYSIAPCRTNSVSQGRWNFTCQIVHSNATSYYLATHKKHFLHQLRLQKVSDNVFFTSTSKKGRVKTALEQRETMLICLSFRKSLMYKCHGNKLFPLNKTNTVFHISCFLIFLMQRKKKANVKQLKANIFYSSNLAVYILFV